MKNNPYLNAVGAAAYIMLIGGFFQFIHAWKGNTPDNWLDPVLALSLLVFSVALMGFLFFYRPVVLLIENKKHEALSFFFKTLSTFGIIGIIVFVIVALL